MKLEVKGLSYKYKNSKTLVLQNISFTAESGSYWCVAGPNGSGKSTLLKLICGLIPSAIATGNIFWDQKDFKTWQKIEFAKQVAFVPGRLRTEFSVSVEDFAAQGRFAHSSFYSRPSKKDYEIVEHALEKTGIISLRQKDITELSEGQMQLVLLARALSQQPKVLVLDEATANLDLYYQWRIFGLLNKLNLDGISIISASHDLNLAAEFSPNILWLNQGILEASGTTQETLTEELLDKVYKAKEIVAIGKNPFTTKPKIFWKKNT